MTKEEMKQVLLEEMSNPLPNQIEMYVKQFYDYPIEEWDSRDGLNFVKGFHSIPDITPDFFRELLQKRKKAVGKLPGLKAMKYISNGIREAFKNACIKLDEKEGK